MDKFNISVQKFDQFAVEYSKRFMDIGSYKDSIDKFCDATENDHPRILDLACGPGNITKYLQDRFPGASLLAIDLAPKMIDIAKQHLPDVDFKVMDVRDILGLTVKFDLIMCSFCLPFLSKADADKLIRDCYAVLEVHGALYISTMEGDESDAGFEPTSFSGASEVYFNYHKQPDIEASFQRAGFQIYYMKRQEYKEPTGVLTDMIFIGKK